MRCEVAHIESSHLAASQAPGRAASARRELDLAFGLALLLATLERCTLVLRCRGHLLGLRTRLGRLSGLNGLCGLCGFGVPRGRLFRSLGLARVFVIVRRRLALASHEPLDALGPYCDELSAGQRFNAALDLVLDVRWH